MRLKLTLLRDDQTRSDIVVTTSATATIGEIARAIAVGDPTVSPDRRIALAAPVTLHVHRAGLVDPEFLMPNRPVGEAHMGSGLTVSLLELDPARDWTRQRLAQVEATFAVVSGPDTGRTFRIDSETNWVGRDADCEIPLDDPMVSKRHARIELEPGLVRFIDNNSANGLVVDGGVVNRVDLIAGARITIGGTELEIVSLVQSVARPQPTNRAGASLEFNRSPRVQVRFPGEELSAPQIPTDELGQGFPWLIMIAPLLMGVVLYIFTQSILSVIFVALSPLLMVGNYFSTRSERKRKRKDSIRRFTKELDKLQTKLDTFEATEREVRLAEVPALRDIVENVERHGDLLWTRRPEHWSFLTVRLGIGRSLSRTAIAKPNANDRTIEEYGDMVDALRERFEYIEGVPLIESLSTAGGIGVAGPSHAAVPYFRGLAVQLLALHSPSEVVCAALVDPRLSGELDWIKWLPHTSSAQNPIETSVLADNASSGGQLLAALEQLVEVRLAGAEAGASTSRPGIDFDDSIDGVAKTSGTENEDTIAASRLPAIVLLVAGEPPVDRGRLVQLLERSVDVGIHPVWLAAERADIPAVCRTFVDVDGDSAGVASVGFVREGREVTPARIEGIDAERATVFARTLSPVVDSSSYSPDDSDLPPSVSFLEIVGPELASDPAAVIDRWRQNESITDRVSATPARRTKPGKLRALVGQAGVDAMHLDLRTQGPHALVGGTTGAGKSEFLQAWVLGMAAEYSPDRVTFLFVDYKGGSAFADCVRLPHCVGLVTDLNTHLVRRALTSLKAEIHYREHLLNRKKAKDLLALERRNDPECPPALVIVIDEFAALAGEIPEFVDGVVDIAQRGRSLGIHLIMATQRPAGVIKDNLRANTNLRVALRMADESDSTDVIGVPVAAAFDPGLPGRGIAKTGPGRLTPFQSGYAGGFTSDERQPARVDVLDLAFGQGRAWEPPAAAEEDTPAESGPNDTARLVETFIRASKTADIPAPRKPWLDELAPVYNLAGLRQRTDTELLIGVADDPARQVQRPVYFHPDEGNLAVFGTGGSGKTTVLRTLAIAAAITPKGGPVEVYGLDFAGGGLRMLEDLPHVGAIIAGDDAERIGRLFGWLRELVDERAQRYGEVRASSITEYRALAKAPQEPRILLLIDGMSTFRQEYEFTGAGGVFTAFQQLLSDGRQFGIHAAVAADRPGSISPSLAASIQRRIALRLADENDYALLEAPSDILSATSPAGRAVVEGLETQVAVLGGSRSLAVQSKAAEDLAATMRANGVRQAPPIRQLDDYIPLATVANEVGGLLPLGVADDTLTPIGIEPSGVFMISGPPVSGRTTLLLTLLEGLRSSGASGLVYSYFGSSRSPVSQLDIWTNRSVTPEEATANARALQAEVDTPANAKRKHIIVIESTADFLSTGADGELAPLIKLARRNEHFVIAESETSTWGQSWPLLMEVKSGRRGFALQPDQLEGELLFKTAFPRAKRSEFPPGRGWLVEAGKLRKVQTAYPE